MLRQLDLGCSGFVRGWEDYECEGIDIVPHPTEKHIKQADLALEDIPFEDNTFDLVTAYDFLEHLPFVLYLPGITVDVGDVVTDVQPYRRDVMIELFNEVYRVLKPDGIFYSQTPIYPAKSAFQDPTHLSFWTDETFNYFSGDYYGFKEHYGHTSNFVQVKKHIENDHIYVELQAKKS